LLRTFDDAKLSIWRPSSQSYHGWDNLDDFLLHCSDDIDDDVTGVMMEIKRCCVGLLHDWHDRHLTQHIATLTIQCPDCKQDWKLKKSKKKDASNFYLLSWIKVKYD